MEKIFIQIPAYRDRELAATLHDLYLKAKIPQRIFAGVCRQSTPQDASEIPEVAGFSDHIRIIDRDAGASEGMGWAKHLAQSLYQDEDYVLAVDSHSRFAQDWDEQLIEQLNRCPAEKAILTSSPHPYLREETSLREYPVGFRYPSHFAENSFLQLASEPFRVLPETPLRAPFIVPRFVFSRGRFIREVPADPYIYFNEEEITLSLRAWCHGWDVFYPAKVLLWHLYNGDGSLRPLHWQDDHDWSQWQQRSIACYQAYLHHEEGFFAGERAIYRLGEVRDAAGFQYFAGVDLAKRQIIADTAGDTFAGQLQAYYPDAPALWRKSTSIPPAVSPSTVQSAKPKQQQQQYAAGRDAARKADRSLLRVYRPELGRQQDLVALEPLRIGDRMPYFILPDADGADCSIDVYAGRYVLLHIVTDIDDSSCVGALAAHHDDVGALRKQYGFAQLGVFPGTPAQFQASPCSRFNIRWCLDPDRRLLGILHESYAAAARSGLLTCFLDPNLTWLDAVTGDHPYDHLQVLINRIAAPVPGYQTLTYHPPVIVTADVLDAALIRRLLDYQAAADDHSGDSQARYRRDVTVVDEALQTALDQAFARSLLPELRKVTGYDLRYREPYRIDCYTAGENGAFHKHRQTEPVAQSHRRYAVSLVLNETFKGAELIFPEYNHACGHYAYAPKAGSAVVFPAPLMHEINPVSVGQCFVLTTFLFDAEQAAYRSCYRQFHDEADDTAHLHTRVEQRFRDLPINSIDTRSLRQSVIDRIGFSRKTLTSSPEPRSEPRLMDTPPGIMVIENYFSAERCRRLREYADAKLGEKLQVVDFAQSSSTKTVSVMSEGRVTERVPLDDIKQQVNNEFTRIYGVILANFYHVEFEWFEEPQMLRYTPGGFYNRHADAEHWLPDEERWVRTLDRDYSALVYLNSDFDGGELYFPRLDFRFKPKQGMLASFPSNYRYEHAAEPITAGMRYALVSWAAILGTPRVKDNAPYGSVFLS